MITLDVALDKLAPLAVNVVVPAAIPVKRPVFDEVLLIGIVTDVGVVATLGELLVILILMAFVAVWELEYTDPGAVKYT